MRDIEIIDRNLDLKEAFGSFKILDEVEIIDHPQIYHFARIVSNYLKMSKKNEKRK